MCCGEVGEKEKEGARGTMVPSALPISSITAIFIGILASAEERGQENCSQGIQTYFRSSLVSTRKLTQVTFRVERSDDRKYVCVRWLRNLGITTHFSETRA